MDRSNVGVLGDTATASEAQPTPPLLIGDIHVLANNTNGDLFHTIRKSNGSWLPFSNVKPVVGSPGIIIDVASTTIGDDLHVFVVTTGGGLFHAIRRLDGSWVAFRSVKAEAGNPGQVEAVAAANVANVLHVAVVAAGGGSARLMHTVRGSNGKFIPFGDVEAMTGDIGIPRDVAMDAIGAELHLAAVASALGGNRLMHTIRKPDGSWLSFGDVEEVAGNLAQVSRVALAEHTGGAMHLAAVANSGMHHAVRHANGSWSSFVKVEEKAGELGEILEAAMAPVGAQVHVLAGSAKDGGGLFHTIRQADGSFLPFRDVEVPAGQIGIVATFSASSF